MTKKLFSGVAVEDIEGTMTADLPDLSVSNAQQAAEDTAVKQNGDFADDEMFAEATAEVGITKDAVAKEDGEEAEEAPSDVPADADPEVAEEAAAAATTEAPVVAEEVTETVAEGETTDADATAEAGEAAEPDEMDEEIAEAGETETSIDADLDAAVADQDDQEDQVEMIEEASEKAVAVEEFLATLQSTRVSGGLDASGARIARMALENFASDFDFPKEQLGLPSQENFEGEFMTYLGRGEATEGFVDSVKSFLDKIIKTIKAAISHAVAFGKKIIVALFGSRAKVIKRADAVIEAAKAAQSGARLKRKQVGGAYVSGALNSAKQMFTGPEAATRMLNAVQALNKTWEPEHYLETFNSASKQFATALEAQWRAVITQRVPLAGQANQEAWQRDVMKLSQTLISVASDAQKPIAGTRELTGQFVKDNLPSVTIPMEQVGDEQKPAVTVYGLNDVLPGSKMLISYIPNTDLQQKSEDGKVVATGISVVGLYKHELVDVKRENKTAEEAPTMSHSDIIKTAETIKLAVKDLDDILAKFKGIDRARNDTLKSLDYITKLANINEKREGVENSKEIFVLSTVKAFGKMIRATVMNVDKPATSFSRHTIQVGNQLLSYCAASLNAYENQPEAEAKVKAVLGNPMAEQKASPAA